MKTIRNVFFTTIMTIGLSTASHASWSWHTGWGGSACDTQKEHYESHHDKCNFKGSKGSHDRWSNWFGNKGSHDKCDHKGAKGSHDRWSNWCGNKGSHDKCDHKGSKGSKGSKCHSQLKGKIRGIVFEDTNNNGKYDRCSDKTLQNVIVNITDAEGTVHQVVTDGKGVFYANKLATGEAVVDINESTLPAGAYIVVGNEPDTVEVVSYGRTSINYYGYALGDPTGNVYGQVFEDVDGNGMLDNGETGVAGISVTLVDANGETHSTVTDSEGKYTFDNIVEGLATVTVDPTSLPDNAELTVGENPNDITIKANEENNAGIDGYTITLPIGSLHGSIINDLNNNGQIDNGESGIEGIAIIVTDVNGDEHTVYTDVNGNYTVDNLPVGMATVAIDRSTLPDNAELTIGEDPNSVEVIAGKNVDAGTDGYVIQTTTGDLHGTLFEDTNYNGVRDANEIGQAGISVIITDAEGNTHIVTTDDNGNYSLTDLPEGTTTIDVNDSTLPENTGLTVGEDPNTIEITMGTSVDAGTDGYSVTALHGTVFSDDNNNGIQDNGETGAENIHIIVTDSNGNTYDIYTDNVGNYSLSNIPSGDTSIEIDTTSLPSGKTITSGSNPTYITIAPYQNTDVGSTGYSDSGSSPK